MQKWEYKFIECIHYKEDWYPAFVDTVEVENWKAGGDIAMYSQTLGDQGWEMVSYVHSVVGSHADYREFVQVVFKRAKG